MKTKLAHILFAACVALIPGAPIPGDPAQDDDEPRRPTPAQAALCHQEIVDARDRCDCEPKGSDAQIVDACSKMKEPKCEPCVVLLQCLESVSDNPDPAMYGAWEQVVPEAGSPAIHGSLGMATIHAVLLPSGKVLLASGSGWRNPIDTETYPEESYPELAEGLFFRHETTCERESKDPFLNDNRDMYQRLVNNTAVYDPAKNTFFRVPPPPLVDNQEEACEKYKGCKQGPGCDRFHASDLFCSGHLHLPDGNPLFMGGTQYYAPIISGVRTSYIFDWRKELATDWIDVDWRDPEPQDSPWIFSGLMERGRWYPTPVPLQDGRLVILSGLRGYDEKEGEGDPYLFEVNSLVEIFDPETFSAADPQKAWKAIDAKTLENSPFTQKLPKKAEYGTCLDKADLNEKDVHSLPCRPEGDARARAEHDFKYDTFKLYPNVYNFGRDRDGGGERLFFTREGDFISMRSPDTATMRKVRKTYWMEIGGDRDNPQIQFELGIARNNPVPSYGSSFIDPNDGSVRVLAGGKTSPGTLFPLNIDWTKRDRFLGARGSRQMETYRPAENPVQGEWLQEEDFLGDHPQDDRILANSILLPTKEVLIINGGNYQLQKPVYHPLLLKPEHDKGKFKGYAKQRMAEATQARQYHAVALLLPDGRVWTSGGNSAPALVSKDEAAWKAWERQKMPRDAQPEHDPDLVDLDVRFFREGRYASHEKGSLELPAENWTAEIYSPPYLFIDGNRRAEIVGIEDSEKHHQVEFEVPGADRNAKVYLLKSNRTYKTKLTGLPTIGDQQDRSGHYRLIKLPSVTHATDFGQRLHELESLAGETGFRTPQAADANIPPGYYMLFFIDAKGKPSEAKMVRFDDNASAP